MKTLLLIEDNDFYRKIAIEVVQKVFFQKISLRIASSFEEAKEILNKGGNFDKVITDLCLPHHSQCSALAVDCIIKLGPGLYKKCERFLQNQKNKKKYGRAICGTVEEYFSPEYHLYTGPAGIILYLMCKINKVPVVIYTNDMTHARPFIPLLIALEICEEKWKFSSFFTNELLSKEGGGFLRSGDVIFGFKNKKENWERIFG